MCIKLLTYSGYSVIGLSFHLLCFTWLLTCNRELNVHCTLDLGESGVLKTHFILNKEAVVQKIQKEAGIHKHHSGSVIP